MVRLGCPGFSFITIVPYLILAKAVADQQRLHVILSGRVQGVGFRFFAVEQASQHRLTGWVRNLGHDRVEVVAEGSPEDLEFFLAKLREGPPLSWVEGVEVSWQAATGEFHAFTARPSAY